MGNIYNENQATAYAGGGISFTGLLTIAFIVLKLCHIIEWSWLWVLAPLWISAALVIVIAIVIAILILK